MQGADRGTAVRRLADGSVSYGSPYSGRVVVRANRVTSTPCGRAGVAISVTPRQA